MEALTTAITSMTGATFSVATAFAGWVMDTPLVLAAVALSFIGFGIGKAVNAIRGV